MWNVSSLKAAEFTRVAIGRELRRRQR